MIWLILLAGYHTFRICIIFLFIKCIFDAEILTSSDAVDFLAYSLGMQYSVVTADQGCSTEMVNKICHPSQIKTQIASGQGSHWLIESLTMFIYV